MHVFSAESDKVVQDDFAANPGNYMKTVDNYIGWYGSQLSSFSSGLSGSSRLQKEYHILNEKLGQMGTGLQFKDVEERSNMWNLIGKFCFYSLYPQQTFSSQNS